MKPSILRSLILFYLVAALANDRTAVNELCRVDNAV